MGSYVSRARAAYGLGAFFVIAGLNHFRDPGFYLPLIPDYLPFPEVLNVLSGVLEVVLGAAVFGVGALVGKERVIDATLSVTEKITGAAHGAVTSARRRS